jgi:hypothetical protein
MRLSAVVAVLLLALNSAPACPFHRSRNGGRGSRPATIFSNARSTLGATYTRSPARTGSSQSLVSTPVTVPSTALWVSVGSPGVTPRLHYATYLLSAPSTYSREADINMPDATKFRFSLNEDWTFTPPPGRYDTLVRNTNGSYSLTPQDSRTVFQFNVDGTLASITDSFGSAFTYTYDTAART